MNSKKAYELEHGTDIRPAHHRIARAKYIWVLDYEDGKVYRYNIKALCNEENSWNPDNESCEAFLHGARPSYGIKNCEWMVTSEEEPIIL
jgi:hypothetical protein